MTYRDSKAYIIALLAGWWKGWRGNQSTLSRTEHRHHALFIQLSLWFDLRASSSDVAPTLIPRLREFLYRLIGNRWFTIIATWRYCWRASKRALISHSIIRKVITASHAAFRVKMKIQLSRNGLGWRMEKVGMNQGWIVFKAWLGRLSAEFSMVNLDCAICLRVLQACFPFRRNW